MVEKFLKAKHWQLFILTFGIPMLFQFVLMGKMFSIISNEPDFNPSSIFESFRFIPLIMFLFSFIYFGWFWSVGTGLDKKIPMNLKLSVGRFKLFLIIPIVYMFCITFFVVTILGEGMNPGAGFNPAIFGLIVPLHLFSMFCIFYCLYFVAKTIKTAELQKEVKFGDFVGEFFLIWFFPIGIWIIQPRINKMIQTEQRDHLI